MEQRQGRAHALMNNDGVQLIGQEVAQRFRQIGSRVEETGAGEVGPRLRL